MNLKHKLALGGVCALVLILIGLKVKWFVPSEFKDHDFTHNTNHSEPRMPPPPPPSAPSSPIQYQVKLKMVPFPKEGIPVLMYHSIKTLPGNSLGVPVKQFSEEMSWLSQKAYHSISPEDLYQALVNKAPVPEKPILLTFDDGYSDNYSSAWPILQQYGFRATFFVITKSVGPGMMNWEQLNDLVKQGNTVASHTVHHLDLATLTEKQQEFELNSSKQELESHLGIRVQSLCFPSGKYNKTTLALMPKCGYKLGFSTKPGNVYLGAEILALNRKRIYGGMPIASFKSLLP